MKPTIFNDVIGPVMRGPSSSHTAASHRIGAIVRQICLPENGNVLVEFHKEGSIATTYEGQGSSMGLISGLLGLSILDPSMTKYKVLAKAKKLHIEFKVTDYEAIHPNTYKIHLKSINNEIFEILAISSGGGMIDVIKINGFEVSIKGDYFETLICCNSSSSDEMEDLLWKLNQHWV